MSQVGSLMSNMMQAMARECSGDRNVYYEDPPRARRGLGAVSIYWFSEFCFEVLWKLFSVLAVAVLQVYARNLHFNTDVCI
jgi:hypothetical protein